MKHFSKGDHVIITKGEYLGKTGRVISKYPEKNEIIVGGFNMYREELQNTDRNLIPRKERERKIMKGLYTNKGPFKCNELSHVEHSLAILTLSSEAYFCSSPISSKNWLKDQNLLLKILEQDLFRILRLCTSCSKIEVLKCLKPNQFLIRQYPENPNCLSSHRNIRCLLDLTENEFLSLSETEFLMDEEEQEEEIEGKILEEEDTQNKKEGEKIEESKNEQKTDDDRKLKGVKSEIKKEESQNVFIKSIDYVCEDGSEKIPLSTLDFRPVVTERSRKVSYVRVPFDEFRFLKGESVVLVEYNSEAMVALKALNSKNGKFKIEQNLRKRFGCVNSKLNFENGLKLEKKSFGVKDWSQFVKFKKAVVIDSFLNLVKIKLISENSEAKNENKKFENSEIEKEKEDGEELTVSFKKLWRYNPNTGKIINKKLPTYKQRVIEISNEDNKTQNLPDFLGYGYLPFDENLIGQNYDSPLKLEDDFYDIAFRVNEYKEVNKVLDTTPNDVLQRSYFNCRAPFKILPKVFNDKDKEDEKKS